MKRSWIVPFAVWAALLVALPAGVFQVSLAHEGRALDDARQDLEAIAGLKARRIAGWLEERRANGGTIRANPFVTDGVDRFLASGLPDPRVERWLAALSRQYGYVAARIATPDGAIAAAWPEGASPPLDATEARALAAALAARAPALSDVEPDDAGAAVLVVAAPLFRRDGSPVAVLVLRGDARASIVAETETWPAPSDSAEALFVRPDGQDVVFLSHTRGGGAWTRRPLADPDLPEAKAARRERGALDGVDYRGEQVVAAAAAVPGTGWALLAKVDRDEVLAPVRARARGMALGALAVVAVAGGLVLLWARREDARARATEDALRGERDALLAQFRLLSRYANDAVLLLDPDGRLLDVNDRAVETYGWSREEMLALTVRDLRPPETAGDFPAQLAEALRGGVRFETLHRRSDGTIFPVEVSSRAFEAGGRRLVQSIVRDVSERRRAEEALRASEESLATTLQSIGDGVIATDDAGRVVRMNAVAEALTGWTLAQARGRPVVEVFAIVNEETRRKVESPVDRVLREGVVVGLANHTALVRPDGTEIPIADSGAPIRDPAGRIVGVVLVFRDATEERDARRAAEAQAKLVASVSDAVIALDAGQRITGWNPAAERIYGFSEAEVLGRDLSFLGGDGVPELLARAEREGRAAAELRQQRRDGGAVRIESAASVLRDAYGVLDGWVIANRDVTARQALQAQLVFAERMASVGTLAAGVAHEINNPLSFVLANVGWAREELAAAAPDLAEVRRALAEATDGAQRVRDIVRDLKTFSRDDPSAPASADVADATRSAASLAQAQIRHRARLVVDVPPLPPVAGSSHRLVQVLLNLLVNAAQAIPAGHAEEHEIRVHAFRRPGGVAIEVRDTGAGIAPEVRARIFDPFFTTKPVGEGTGLGLAICHGIVTAAGGAIEVESTPGRGATFRVLLPAAGPEPAPAPPPSAPAAPRRRVLVVDDEPLVGRSLVRVLAEHEVEVVTSGREALERLAAGSYDLVLCDLMMPEMTGIELHAAIRARHPAQRVAFATGGAFTAETERFVAEIGAPVLDKPFDADALRAVLAAIPPG